MYTNWEKILMENSQPFFYITNDVSRAIGIEEILPNYHIVCLDDHPLVDYLEEKKIKIFCLERFLKQRNKIFRSTSKIINHPAVLEYIQKNSGNKTPNIVFFKPSAKIDFICKKNKFLKVGNSARINNLFEDKINFYELCLRYNLPVCEGEIGVFGLLDFKDLAEKYNLPLVIQFGRGWAGNTTYFVEKENVFENLKNKFKNKKVKITRFINGKTVLNNACIFEKNIFISQPAIQIPAIEGFTSLKGATCGRQWPINLGRDQEKKIQNLTKKVGMIMAKFGYKGFFGLDFIIENSTGNIFISENNARLTASVPFFTKLEISKKCIPLFLYHLLAFNRFVDLKKTKYESPKILGSEVLARNDKKVPVMIKKMIWPGVYLFKANKLKLIRKEYYPKDLKGDECFVSTASYGRVVNPEQELIRVNLSSPVLNGGCKLRKDIVNMVQKIKINLKLEKC